VGVARAKRRVECDIGRPVGRRHSVIEQDTDHPITEPGQPIVDGGAILVGLVAGLDVQDRAVPAKDGGRSVEDLSLVSLDVDLDQVEPGEVVLGGQRIEAAQRDPESVVPGKSGFDPRGAGVGAGRRYDRHGNLRDPVVVADRATDDFGLS